MSTGVLGDCEFEVAEGLCVELEGSILTYSMSSSSFSKFIDSGSRGGEEQRVLWDEVGGVGTCCRGQSTCGAQAVVCLLGMVSFMHPKS
jgi:hypothetical protein